MSRVGVCFTVYWGWRFFSMNRAITEKASFSGPKRRNMEHALPTGDGMRGRCFFEKSGPRRRPSPWCVNLLSLNPRASTRWPLVTIQWEENCYSPDGFFRVDCPNFLWSWLNTLGLTEISNINFPLSLSWLNFLGWVSPHPVQAF